MKENDEDRDSTVTKLQAEVVDAQSECKKSLAEKAELEESVSDLKEGLTVSIPLAAASSHWHPAHPYRWNGWKQPLACTSYEHSVQCEVQCDRILHRDGAVTRQQQIQHDLGLCKPFSLATLLRPLLFQFSADGYASN